MSVTKIIKRARENLDVIALDMENLDRQNMADFVNRRRLWIKVLRNSVNQLDSILNFKKGKDETKKRKTD